MDEWINGLVFGHSVEKRELPRSKGRPYYPNIGDLNVVLHTTEGSSVAGALSALATNNAASHFLVGEGRILQLRPLAAQAGSLRLNPPHNPNNGCIQIEAVGFSQTHLWLPDDDTLQPLVALAAWLQRNLGIPFQRPAGFLDDMSDCPLPWAANNARRQRLAIIWPWTRGWLGHIDVPWQQPSYHWDPGHLNWTKLFEMAAAL